MKTIHYLAAIFLFIGVGSCSKDGPVGPMGPKGEKGEQGVKGMDGTMLRYGKGAPSISVGQEGDFYVDMNKSILYGPKASAGWGNGVNLIGAKGDRGATGATGAKGDKGDKGDRGATGATGAKGDKGDKGDRGATGATGAKGDKGDKGDTGATGAKGKDGSQFLSGTPVPTTQGTVGDFYFHTTTATLYGPKTSAGWGSGVSLKGPKGDKGDKGDKGEDGNANVITMGWTIVTSGYWKNLSGYGSGSGRWLSFDRPGDKGLRVVEDIFIVNTDNLTGAILVYANNGTGSRMLPFEDTLTAQGKTGTLEHRFVFRSNKIYLVVALRDGAWDINYVMNTYLPSINGKSCSYLKS